MGRLDDLILLNDEAWTPEERKGRRPYQKLTNEQRRTYKRDWMRRWRAQQPQVIGSLHDLACSGPFVKKGCLCNSRGTKKILVYDKPVRRAA